MKNKGFTLIEILVVVSITGILVGTSVLSFYKSASQQNFRKTVNDIKTGLKKAKDEAYFGKRNGDCTDFSGKSVGITNNSLVIYDICEGSKENQKIYTEFVGGINISGLSGLDIGNLEFPSGPSVEYPSGSIQVFMTNSPTNIELIDISSAISAE